MQDSQMLNLLFMYRRRHQLFPTDVQAHPVCLGFAEAAWELHVCYTEALKSGPLKLLQLSM